ncbi:hypothetical protein STRTUCAR8_06416 [Streptomyces turgidiscabies Car8]|uniref:Uncharacterized protein n=1 Tax=Streptomyces turgidiscabies (strain Car8) TaxID=698760 RepID=L7EVC4_STRT8|nr:hypothetical protein STRTUCAR8_06416 [Streptomyces turgidiscabies Car8]
MQRSAVQVLADLIDQHPELPSASVMIHRPWKGTPSELQLVLEMSAGFEQWRAAIGIAPENTDLYLYAGDSWISARTVHKGIDIRIAVHGIALTTEQANAPRDTKGVAA